MTLLELIRNLHADGKPVVDYDFYVTYNSAMDIEDILKADPEFTTVVRMRTPYIPPANIELGDRVSYLYVSSISEYREAAPRDTPTLLQESSFPRLLVAIYSDRSNGFLQLYKGKSWTVIPPLEVEWLEQDELLLPVLDSNGNLEAISYDGYVGMDETASYYKVSSKYGSTFAWNGNIISDKLPDGLRLLTK